VFSGGKLFVSKNYTQLRMLGNGPIRFSFEVSYAPWDANGTEVSETKTITLDAGTHMNRIESTYTWAGSSTLDLAAAIAVHEGASAKLPVAESIASVWDTPQIPSAGKISTGLVALPMEHAKTLDAAGHALLIFTRHSGEPFTYLAGSGWSKADMPTSMNWNDYLKLQLDMLQHPITTRWVKR
jgi:pectinesterase